MEERRRRGTANQEGQPGHETGIAKMAGISRKGSWRKGSQDPRLESSG